MQPTPSPQSDTSKNPMTVASDGSLLRAIEVWRPAADSEQLVCVNGHYDDCEPFANFSKGAKPDPMISQITDSGLPMVFSDLAPVMSTRLEGAVEAGVTSALGVPTVIGGVVSAVTMMYFSESAGIVGAIESWVPDKQRRELTLGTGHYINLGLFEKTSRCIKWPFGAGLPGLTWRTAMPQLVAGIGRSPAFIRGADAHDSGLDVGMSFPIFSSVDDIRAIVLLLSSTHSPMAKLFGLWVPDEDGPILKLERLCASEGTGANVTDWQDKLKCEPFEGIAGKAWSSRTPVLETHLADGPEPDRISEVCSVPLSWGLALPSIVGNRVHAVCTLYG